MRYLSSERMHKNGGEGGTEEGNDDLHEGNSFVRLYKQYAEHTVVADELFFGTILRNTKFCLKHHNDNFLFLQFDRWESDLGGTKNDDDDGDASTSTGADIGNGEMKRNVKKCLSPDPNRCGRSPTILSKDDYFALELSDALFARKVSSAPGYIWPI